MGSNAVMGDFDGVEVRSVQPGDGLFRRVWFLTAQRERKRVVVALFG